MKILSLVCCLAIFFTGCSPDTIEKKPISGPALHILFVGNSYIFVNDLPKVFAQLAAAGGHKVTTGMMANGGWTLAHHANSAETLNAIQASKWDYVIMHEQSQIPAFEQSRRETMYPAARYLVPIVKQRGAAPVFFLTWAHRQGWPERGMPDYESMQAQIEQGYLEIARELDVAVAPVGQAWSRARREYPELELWQGDGSHPSELGTYLAASVFYAVIFRQSPEGLKCPGSIPPETARRIQGIAAKVVLENPKQWNIPSP
jgi:hypothetical protein